MLQGRLEEALAAAGGARAEASALGRGFEDLAWQLAAELARSAAAGAEASAGSGSREALLRAEAATLMAQAAELEQQLTQVRRAAVRNTAGYVFFV